MKGGDLPPKFQFALRRCIFFLLCLCIWIVFGTLILTIFTKGAHSRVNTLIRDRVDTKRVELLNVLWAETIAKTENDWAEMANHKLEMYEKTLLASLGIHSNSNEKGFAPALQKAFGLATTIGPLDIDDFTTAGKIFAVFFMLIGTPLCLHVVSQCGRMFSSIWEGRTVFFPTACFVFFSAVVYDIIEGGDDDVPFMDAIFSIFLQFSTVGEEDNDGLLPYAICLIGLALTSACYSVMQHEIEKFIHSYELTFYRLFSWAERRLQEEKEDNNLSSSNRNSRIEEIEEEEEGDDY